MLLLSAFLLAAAASPVPAQQYYRSRYDHLDIESILNNRRMVNHYAACLLSQGPCPPQGTELKEMLPEALSTNCAKCTEKQKTTAYRAIKRLQKEYPKIWSQLQAVWDPQKVYVPKFEATFENTNSVMPTTNEIFDRFGDSDNAETKKTVIINNSNNSTNKSSTSTNRPSTSTTSTNLPSSTTTRNPSTTSTSSTRTTKITSTFKPTFRPFFVASPPQQTPPFATVGANIKATVSFGTNLVGGIVRSLGDLGSRVVESGTKFANAVISTVIRH